MHTEINVKPVHKHIYKVLIDRATDETTINEQNGSLLLVQAVRSRQSNLTSFTLPMDTLCTSRNIFCG